MIHRNLRYLDSSLVVHYLLGLGRHDIALRSCYLRKNRVGRKVVGVCQLTFDHPCSGCIGLSLTQQGTTLVHLNRRVGTCCTRYGKRCACYGCRCRYLDVLNLHCRRADRLCHRVVVIVEHHRGSSVERTAGCRYNAETCLCLIAVAKLYGQALAAEGVRYELWTLYNRLLYKVAGIRKVYHKLYIAYTWLIHTLEVD